MEWFMQIWRLFYQSACRRGCRLLFNIVQLGLLVWLENADGHIHLHAEAGQATGGSADYRESQIPGFVKVTMSRDKGVGIGPHQFKPLNGSLAFSLIQVGDRWYYEVIEQMPQRVRTSYVDAVTGVLTNPQTGKAVQLE
jgi:hypothetical protein